MKQSAEYDIVCIGSGPAGQRAAIQAAKLGKRVAVIEKQHTVGGFCTELIHVGRRRHRARTARRSRDTMAGDALVDLKVCATYDRGPM